MCSGEGIEKGNKNDEQIIKNGRQESFFFAYVSVDNG